MVCTFFSFILTPADESHRVGARTYQDILNHFKPAFLLGMTATPERSDQHNICNDFDYNIAYEIRLQEALKEEMLCPFHYFGITEIAVDGQVIDDTTEFNHLIKDERVRNMIEQINFYGHDGRRVKGLVFCSRNEEAKELSKRFNLLGYRTLALSGEDKEEDREAAIKRLELNEDESCLDYIFTVDIFNEGIDIPSINQVIMLRPTQSAIIFVQQLGRGLRKVPNKEFVIILDFIGNYKNNFMIPMALSDDRSFNKDTIRRYVSEGSRVIPGSSTINFDAVARKRIFESIDTVNFNSVEYIKESYKNLKYRLGRIPMLMDFEEHDSMDMARIFENASLGSYHQFLVKYEEDYQIELEADEVKFIELISKKFAIGKRVHELLVLRGLVEGEEQIFAYLKKQLDDEYQIEFKDKTRINIINILTNQFLSGAGKNTYNACIFITKSGDDYSISPQFNRMLEKPEFRKMVIELIDFGLYRNQTYYGERYKNTSFQLYQKYAYEDVCRLLEWEKNEVPLNIGGYKYDEKTKTYPVFINYDKGDDIDHSINYEDRFVSTSSLIALSKSKRTKESNDIVTSYRAQELGVDIELFVRKNKDDKISKEFYYLGRVNTVGEPNPIKMKVTGHDAVEINYHLETAVREDIYDYLVE